MTVHRITAIALSFAAALTLPACMGAEGKVRRGLINAGLSEGMATCMATPMARELSINQLMKLNSLSGAKKMDLGRTSLDEFLKRTRALQDPEIMRVTARAATDCFIQKL
jgi:hypothetical protein